MKKSPLPKLTLHRETLRTLPEVAPKRLAAGYPPVGWTQQAYCTVACNLTNDCY